MKRLATPRARHPPVTRSSYDITAQPSSATTVLTSVDRAASLSRTPCSVRTPNKTCALFCAALFFCACPDTPRPQRATEFITKRKALNEQFTRRAVFAAPPSRQTCTAAHWPPQLGESAASRPARRVLGRRSATVPGVRWATEGASAAVAARPTTLTACATGGVCRRAQRAR